MSQRPPASHPASRSPPDGRTTTLPPVQHRGDALPDERRADPPAVEQFEGRRLAPQHGRPLQPAPSGEDWRQGPSRDLGVRSILNPADPDDSSSSGRRVSSGETDSPLSAVGPPSQFGASPSTALQHSFPGQQQATDTPPAQPGYGASLPRSRAILTPRSPRNSGLGQARGQTIIDAARQPLLPGRARAYMAEPGQSASSDTPPTPTSPGQVQSQQHYSFPPASKPQRTSAIMQAPVRTSHSQSTSPRNSQASQNPSSSLTSPAPHPFLGGGPPSTQGYFTGSTFAPSEGRHFGAGAGGQEGLSSTIEGPYSAPPPPPPTQPQAQPGTSSTVSGSPASRQTSASDPIQVLRITTSQGVYNVPVDVHQASRSADEKRKRNAGASARFRARRKDKEREASALIEKMQGQSRDLERRVRELEQERDFYRGERDRLRELIYRTPDMRHLAMQAPPSPQGMRTGSFQGSGMGREGLPPSQQGPTMGFQQETSQERPPRRRRTGASGEFTGVQRTLPPSSTLPPVQSVGYSPGPTSLPPLRIESTTALPTLTTGTNIPPVTTAGPPPPFEPHSRGLPGPYDQGWPTERGGRR